MESKQGAGEEVNCGEDLAPDWEKVAAILDENAQLRKRIDEILALRITHRVCMYCQEVYLVYEVDAHLRSCEKHPYSALAARVEVLQKALEKIAERDGKTLLADCCLARECLRSNEPHDDGEGMLCMAQDAAARAFAQSAQIAKAALLSVSEGEK